MGCTVTGGDWKFMKLAGTQVFVDEKNLLYFGFIQNLRNISSYY
jgi:hypothetical protein